MSQENIYENNNNLAALEIYEKALITHPFNAVLHSNISCILLRLNRIDEADKEADRAIQLRPDWPEAYITKGEALWKNGLSSEALVRFSYAIRLEENNIENIQNAQKKAIEAFDEFPINSLRMLNMQNSGFMIISTIGIVMARQGHLNEATEILTNCLHMKEGHPKMLEIVIEYLAITYFKLKNYIKCIKYYEKLLQSLTTSNDDDDVKRKLQIRQKLAMASEASHNFQLAIIQRQSILESEELIDEEAVTENLRICELLLKDGQPQKALQALCQLKQNSIILQTKAIADKICVLEGSAHMIQGNTSKCLLLLEHFRSDNSEVMLRCLESVHICLTRDGRIDDCILYETEIIQIASERADFKLKFKATLSLAKSNANKKKISESLILTQSLLTAENEISTQMLKDVLSVLIEIHEKNKNWSSALTTLKKLLKKCDRGSVEYINCCLDISRMLKNLPQMQQQQKSYIMMAIESSDLCAHPPSKVLSRSSLIRFLIEQGSLKEIEVIIEKYKDMLNMEISNALKAIVISDLTKMNNNEEFREIDFNNIEENPLNQIICSVELAEVEMEKKNYEKAEGLLREGLEISINMQVAQWILKCFVKLTNLYMIICDFGNCLLCAGNGLRLAELMNDQQAISHIFSIKSQLFIEQNKLKEAIYSARKAMRIAENDNLTEERIRCYEILIKIFKISEKEEQIIKYQNKLEEVMVERIK